MRIFYSLFIFVLAFISQQKDPWTPAQLMPPAQLAAIIQDDSADQPLILCVGPGALIKGSVDIGPASESKPLDKLKSFLSGKQKNERIVIYCGCCPFEHCPNIRPAFALLNQMGFKRHQLLNLSHNLRTDWIDHGYQVQPLPKLL